ncbi:MAG TPA: alpha/beta fold hydrolase [Ardenticatenaceae bacterium]|nr:alpha/beta fold hydrolase [Ardenticatenaceae bacterium]
MSQRPAWLNEDLYPFQSRFLAVRGCDVHYVDEGSGPILLMLHGNPTWSFLYRDIVKGLRQRFRCIALDYPGFGLSRAPAGYEYTPREHAQIVEQFLLALGLSGVTMMVHDWGGPIGLGVAERHPDRFDALVIGNTFAWPLHGTLRMEAFSRFLGGPIGRFLICRFNAFVNLVMPLGTKRRLPPEVMAAYRGPFSTRASRWPTYVFPREILGSRDYLAEVEQGLRAVSHLPTLIVWGEGDAAFQAPERRRFEQLFPGRRTVLLHGARHYIQEDAGGEITDAILDWWDNRG